MHATSYFNYLYILLNLFLSIRIWITLCLYIYKATDTVMDVPSQMLFIDDLLNLLSKTAKTQAYKS